MYCTQYVIGWSRGAQRHLLQYFEVVEHSWIGQCNGFTISNTFPLDLIPFKTIHTSGGKMKHRYVHVVYNYCIPFVASNTHIPAVVVAAPKMRQPNPTVPIQFSSEYQVHNLLQFFQWLVLLQCCGQSYGSSGGQRIVVDTVVEVMHAESNWLLRTTWGADIFMS